MLPILCYSQQHSRKVQRLLFGEPYSDGLQIRNGPFRTFCRVDPLQRTFVFMVTAAADFLLVRTRCIANSSSLDPHGNPGPAAVLNHHPPINHQRCPGRE
jgi:hypothetical protein